MGDSRDGSPAGRTPPSSEDQRRGEADGDESGQGEDRQWDPTAGTKIGDPWPFEDARPVARSAGEGPITEWGRATVGTDDDGRVPWPDHDEATLADARLTADSVAEPRETGPSIEGIASAADAPGIDERLLPADDADAGGSEPDVAPADGADPVSDATATPAPVGLAVGSTETVVALSTDGERTIRTPTCVAAVEDPLTGAEQRLYGEAALEGGADRATFPLGPDGSGEVVRGEVVATLVSGAVRGRRVPTDCVLVYAAPAVGDSERAALERHLRNDGLATASIRRFPAPLCGAVSALDGASALERTLLVVHAGQAALQVAVYRRGEPVARRVTHAVSGDTVDRAIVDTVADTTGGGVGIDRTTARAYRRRHAVLGTPPSGDTTGFSAAGFRGPTGSIHDECDPVRLATAVGDILEGVLEDAVATVAADLLPALADDQFRLYRSVLDEPIVLVGDLAAVAGLADAFRRRLSEAVERDVTVVVPDRPALAAAEGARTIARELLARGAY